MRGKGFPDLAMFRKNPETGTFEMLVAELKRDANSEFGEGQEEWLEAFREMGITTKIWRGDSADDLAEMYEIIEKGTAGHDSVTEVAPHISTQIPVNFGIAMRNTIEYIQGNEMTTGEKASLRRMDLEKPNSAIFWKLMSQPGMRGVVPMKGGLIMHGIALMAHRDGRAHHATTPVGRALYVGGQQQPGERGFYSEDRLSTLLAARGPALHKILARLFRMLANEGVSFDWHEMARFILNEGYNEAQADQCRIKIASAYYRAQRSAQRASNNEGN